MDKIDKIIFAGGGGHALSLLESLPSDDCVEGYLAPSPTPSMPVAYLGDDVTAPELIRSRFLFHIAFVYAGLPLMNKRRSLISLYENYGAEFASVIAKSAIVTRHSKIGKGVAILNGAIVNRASIGDFCIINSGAIVEHDCQLDSNTFIGPGCVIGGGTVIGKNCFIGLGSKIKNGITIADDVTVGMGAVVTRNLLKPGIYHGSPLRCFNLSNK
ncbi:MAG: transferase [Bacteroides sp.]|nr:transferase [Bacteroides sp.]